MLRLNACLRCQGTLFDEFDKEINGVCWRCLSCGYVAYFGGISTAEAEPGPGRTRRATYFHSAEFRALVVRELNAGVPVPALAQRYGVNEVTVREWKRQAVGKGVGQMFSLYGWTHKYK